MDMDRIDSRIERALAANARAEKIFVGLALTIVAFGVIAMVLAYRNVHPLVAAATALLQAFLWYPVAGIRQLRRENSSLQAVRVLVASVPPDRAIDEITKLLALVRGETPAPPVSRRQRLAG